MRTEWFHQLDAFDEVIQDEPRIVVRRWCRGGRTEFMEMIVGEQPGSKVRPRRWVPWSERKGRNA